MHGTRERENNYTIVIADVIVGFEQNYTVSENVGSFQACFRVFNPPDNQELILSMDLVVDTIEGSAGILVYIIIQIMCTCVCVLSYSCMHVCILLLTR